MVSVVRDSESQLLPNVGVVVTCKVGHWSAALTNCTASTLSPTEFCSCTRIGWGEESLGFLVPSVQLPQGQGQLSEESLTHKESGYWH